MDPFAKLRPYTDAEAPAALRRIVDDALFPQVAPFLYPDRPLEETKDYVASFTSVRDFQRVVMIDLIDQIIRRSMTDFTFEFSPLLDPDRRYLFVANHRDIVLDAMMLDHVLVHQGQEIPQATIGSNLMEFPMMADVSKMNRLFCIDRKGTPHEFYNMLLNTSQYIRHVLTECHESVWIAQHNGRAKDGSDTTEPAVIKMLGLSGEGTLTQRLDALHIVPVTISYEWESCDLLKAEELFHSRNGAYIKAPGEDVRSILTGINQYKGHVHLVVGDPLTFDELALCHDDPRQVATLLDSKIRPNYRLYPNNFIAADMLGIPHEPCTITDAQRHAFIAQMDRLAQPDDPVLRDIFLHIYANPVLNRQP